MKKPITEALQHSRWAPSAASRWSHCPGSVPLSAGCPDNPTEASAEGTLLHDIAAGALRFWWKNKTHKNLTRLIGEKFIVGSFEFVLTAEQVGLVEWCVERVEETINDVNGLLPDPNLELHVEVGLDLAVLHPGCYGTADIVIIVPSRKLLIVLDNKFGYKPVYARDNEQFICYSIGVLDWYAMFQDFTHVVVGTLQPRHNNFDTHEYMVEELDAWRGRLQAAIRATLEDDPPLAAGDWCAFCPARAHCPELGRKTQALIEQNFDVVNEDVPLITAEKLPSERIAEILKQSDMIRGFLDAIHDEAHRRLEVGLDVPGYKLVEGRRGYRQWADREKMQQWALNNGLDPFNPPSVVSVAEMERRVKSNPFRIQFDASLIAERPLGRPALVPLSDSRASCVPADGVFGLIEEQDSLIG